LVPRAQGKTEAIQQLSRGLKRERHAVDYTAAVLRLDPEWEPLKTEPEFADLIAEAETVERSSDPTAKKRSAEVNPPEKTGAKK
jgi:hypothetical protein